MGTIAELVARRTDLGTFLVHFTREFGGRDAKTNFAEIITNKRVKALSPFGPATKVLQTAIAAGNASNSDLNSQNSVCFTETPLEHLHLFLSEIDDTERQCKFAPYGVALTKKIARKIGINPIWYIDITPGHHWLMNNVNSMVQQAIDAGEFAKSDVAKIAPFIEQMGYKQGAYKKEFWWEREWRKRGSLSLPSTIILICPEAEHEEFQKLAERNGLKASCLDSQWGLESIIARLAGFDANEVGPF